MKTMKAIVFVAVVLSLSAVSWGQITITQGSFSPVGATYTSYSSSGLAAVTPGASGANVTWTVPTQAVEEGIVTTIVAPGSTPYGSTYPTATHAATSAEAQSWSYLRVASDAVTILGYAALIDTLEFIVVYNPVETLAPLPLSYPHGSWTSVSRYEMEVIPGFGATITDSTIYTVDGYGTINTQYGSWQVLRVYSHSWLSTSFMGLPPTVTESVMYTWINEHGVSVCSMSPEDTNPNFTSAYVNFDTEGGSAADPVRGPVARNFEVGQNFPNPFNPTTTLPLELANGGRVEVSIYNEAGQLVSHEEMLLPAGQHNLPVNGSSWASGSYFAQVSAGNDVQTKRMSLVK